MGYKLLPHPPYDSWLFAPGSLAPWLLAPSSQGLCSDFKRVLAGKRFSSNEAVIAETEDYFEANNKSQYKNGFEEFKIAIIDVSLLKGFKWNKNKYLAKQCVYLT